MALPGTPSVVINKPETNASDVVMTENIIISEINKDDSKIEEVEHIDTSPKPTFNEEKDGNIKEVGSVTYRFSSENVFKMFFFKSMTQNELWDILITMYALVLL